MKQNLVVLSGAGVSAESGLRTFRDSDGLWEEYSIMEVATPEAWNRNPELVLQFYNERRIQMRQAEPNAAHKALALLDEHFNVQIITQNVDDLHERGGSQNVMHLHGELNKVRSEKHARFIYDVKGDTIKIGDLCERGSQLRPHIVWFGEEVPMISTAIQIISKAQIILVIGTSLNVYPAAGLLYHAPYESRKYLIDPAQNDGSVIYKLEHIKENAGSAVPALVEKLILELASQDEAMS
jgi:NAD-dependent deacetylase